MQPKACIALFALGLALAHAIPASRIEKKSVSDEATFDKNLKAEELGDDKERSKKSTFCMEIKDKASQVGPVQTVNLVPQTQTYSIPSAQQAVQTYNIPSAQQSVQTYSIPSAQQSVQTYNIPSAQQSVQTYSIPTAQQPVQTLSVIQAQPQPPAPQAVVIPQPVQPIHTLQIIQPPQPCPQQPSVNIVQPPVQEVKEVDLDVNVEPEPTPAPVPQTTTHRPAKIVKPHYVPERIVVPQMEQLDMSIVPMAPYYKEQMYVVPSKLVVPETQNIATMVKVPHCHHSHQSLVQCNCKPTNMGMEPMRILALQRSKVMGGHALVPRQADASEEKKE